MRLVLQLDVASGKTELIRSFLRQKAPSARDLAALIVLAEPNFTARLAGTGRHKWIRSYVEVPWSSVPHSIYTCALCGTMKQSLPPDVAGGQWITEYRLPGCLDPVAKRPPCPGGGRYAKS